MPEHACWLEICEAHKVETVKLTSTNVFQAFRADKQAEDEMSLNWETEGCEAHEPMHTNDAKLIERTSI